MESTNNKENLSSIELTKNSKGYNWNIKIYFNDEIIDKPLDRIVKIDNSLKSTYSK